jgi:hypothetical protein
MKKLSILTTLFASMLLVSCGGSNESSTSDDTKSESSQKITKTQDEAVAHNNSIIADEQLVYEHEHDLIDMVVDRLPAEEVKKGLETYKQEVASLIEKYNNMTPFDEKDIMRLAILDFLNDVQDIIKNDLTPFVDLYDHDFESLTEEELDLLGSYADACDGNMEIAINKFMAQQKIFAKDYNITLI